MSMRLRRNVETIEVDCTVDIEQTADSFHAYVELQGVEAGPGDEVIVHDAPTYVAFGDHVICQRRATLRCAKWHDRVWAYVSGYMELAELFEVGFSGGRLS
jgi:hypothetical protein